MSDIEKEVKEVEAEFQRVNAFYKDLVTQRAELDRRIATARDDLTRLQGAARCLQRLMKAPEPTPGVPPEETPPGTEEKKPS